MVQVLTGTQLPIDAATIADMAAKNLLTARGQDITSRGQDISANMAQNTYNADVWKAKQQFYLDSARLGLDQATANYNQRMGQAQQTLAAITEGSNQRLAAANTTLAGLKMLADRSGPQDWVSYNRLLNGMNPQTPGAPTTAFDPTSLGRGIVDPQFRLNPDGTYTSGNALPNLAGMLGNLNQPYNAPLPTMDAAPTYTNPTTGAATVAPFSSAPPAQVSRPVDNIAQPTQPIDPTGNGSIQKPYVQPNNDAAALDKNDPNQWYSGVPGSQVAGLTSGQRALVTTGMAGPSQASDYAGFNVYEGNTPMTGSASIAPGTPLWVQKLSTGTKHGLINDLIAIVGEGKGQKPGKSKAQKTLGNTGEMLYNPTHAPMGVLNNDQAKQMLQGQASVPGMQQGQQGQPQQGAPAFNRGTGMSTTTNFHAPHMARVPGVPPSLRIPKAGKAPRIPRVGSGQPSFGAPNTAVQQPVQPAQPVDPNAPTAYSGVGNAGQGTAFPPLSPSDMQNIMTMPRMSRGSGMGMIKRYADGTGYGMDPTHLTYTSYTPGQTGNQPFYNKLINSSGQRNPTFTGLGAPLNAPDLGITNAPGQLNLQNYNALTPSEQDMTNSLYSQGLGVDFRDMLARAQAGSVAGQQMGPTRYGS